MYVFPQLGRTKSDLFKFAFDLHVCCAMPVTIWGALRFARNHVVPKDRSYQIFCKKVWLKPNKFQFKFNS